MIERDLTRQDFHFDLPEELIAQEPAVPRDSARLLHLDKTTGAVRHHVFRELPDLLSADICLVLNDSKVIRARLWATAEDGGRSELFLLRQLDPLHWEVLGSFPEGMRWEVQEVGVRALGVYQEGTTTVEFSIPIEHRLEHLGEVPLPPYVKTARGAAGYQTIYAREEGSVAAPTAGLHFTEEVFRRLRDNGVQIEAVTLHVGYGTFQEVKDGPLREHAMHTERFSVSAATAAALNEAKSRGKTVLTVGTSATRVLETQAEGGKVKPGSGETNLFIYPPYRWRFVDAMLTNFHMPDRSPLMLVAALAGREKVLAAYREAVRERYRFYSFGDSMLVL